MASHFQIHCDRTAPEYQSEHYRQLSDTKGSRLVAHGSSVCFTLVCGRAPGTPAVAMADP